MRAKCVTNLSLLLALWGCGDGADEGSGSLSIVVEPEDSIISGLDSGDEIENIRDGWQVRFDKFIVAIGHIELHFATDASISAENADVFLVDLKTVPASGLPLWQFPDLRAGRWEFHYETAGAAHGAIRHDSVSQADFDVISQEDGTYLVAGTLTKSGGTSCPPPSRAVPGAAVAVAMNAAGHSCYANPEVAFFFIATAETVFGPCEVDGVPGVSIADGSSQTVATTLHGDHLFFNGFPEGDEGGVLRLAQWLADCDLNLDGHVGKEELEAIAPADLPEIDARYQLGGSPITPLANMWDYVVAQLKTQGHMNGEGECPVDGMSHEHED